MARTARIRTARLRTAPLVSALAALAAVAALLLVPAAGHAKTVTFGTRLDHEPSNSAPGHTCREDGSEDPTPACTRVAIDMGAAVPGGLRAPANGTIVAFRVRAGAPGDLTFRLARLTGLGYDPALGEFAGFGKGAGTGPAVHVAGRGFDETNPVEEFPAHVKVRKGDYLAIDSAATAVLYCSGGGSNQLIFSTPLGRSFSPSSQAEGCDLLVQAVMKTAPKHRRRGHR